MFSYWSFSLRLLTCPRPTFLFRNQFINPLLLKGTIIKHYLYPWFSSSFLPSQHNLIWFQGQHNNKTVSPATDHLVELNPVWILEYFSTSLLRDISCVLKCFFLAKVANVALPIGHLAAIPFMLHSCQSVVWLWLLLSSRPSGMHFFLLRTLSLFPWMAVAYPLALLSSSISVPSRWSSPSLLQNYLLETFSPHLISCLFKLLTRVSISHC